MAAKIALAFSILPDAPPAALIQWAKEADDAGFAGVFMTEGGNDSLACSLALGLNTSRIMLGTAITQIYLRHPMLLANEAAAVDGGRTGPRVTKRLPIYMAGVSRPMVRLAGEIGDGVIFNYFPPARVKEAIGELAEGARKAGRDPKDIEPTLFATAFVSDDLEAARRPARKLLSRYGALRFYGNMIAKSGFEKEIEGIRAAGRDADKAMAAVSNEMIDATLLVGSEARVRERIQELAAPGVGTVIVFTNPVNEDRASAVRRTIRSLKNL